MAWAGHERQSSWNDKVAASWQAWRASNARLLHRVACLLSAQDDVHARFSVDDSAELSDLERVGCVFERLLHGAATETIQVASLRCGAAVCGGHMQRDRGREPAAAVSQNRVQITSDAPSQAIIESSRIAMLVRSRGVVPLWIFARSANVALPSTMACLCASRMAMACSLVRCVISAP